MMNTVFLYTAAIGGSFLVLQFLLLLFGVGGDSDGAHGGHALHGHADDHGVGHDQGSLLRLLSLQTVATFATFFGLTGLGCEQLGWSPLSVAGTAVLVGGASLLLVARAMRALLRLQSSGTLGLGNAVGQSANVYLRVPAHGNGCGRVLVAVQGRTVECRAVSRGDEIPTGAPVRVVDRTDDEVLVVEPRV